MHVLSHWLDDFPTVREYIETHANPELFPYFDGKKLKANKLHTKLLSPGKTLEEKMYLLSKYIGAYNGEQYTGALNRIPGVSMIKVTPKLHNRQFLHGWYEHGGTRVALEGAIQYYKPKIVLEFGVWYGKSSIGILQSATTPITYIGVDWFSPAVTSPKHVTQTPLDKLFLDHPRLETAVSNLAPYSKKHDVYLMITSLERVLDKLKDHNIVPDLLFVDAIKNGNELGTIVSQYLKYNPDIVIVSDDRKEPSIQRAVDQYKKSTLNVREYGEQGCILTRREIPESLPPPVSYFEDYPTLRLTPAERKQVPEELQFYLPAQRVTTPQ